MDTRAKQGKVNPLDKRKVKLSKKSMANSEKGVKAVAKDTNKTRRKMVKPAKGNLGKRKDF